MSGLRISKKCKTDLSECAAHFEKMRVYQPGASLRVQFAFRGNWNVSNRHAFISALHILRKWGCFEQAYLPQCAAHFHFGATFVELEVSWGLVGLGFWKHACGS